MRSTQNRNPERAKWSPWSCKQKCCWTFAALTFAAILGTGIFLAFRHHVATTHPSSPGIAEATTYDARTECERNVTDDDLKKISSLLWENDEGRIPDFDKFLNLHGKPPNRLFDESLRNIDFWGRPSVKAFVSLVEDFDISTENAKEPYLNEAMKSYVMNRIAEFLEEKRCINSKSALRQTIQEAWFHSYFDKQSKSKKSSGFSHVFVGETYPKSTIVGGFHNWIRFYQEEKKGRLIYKNLKGDTSKAKVAVATHFKWKNKNKSFGSMLVGTSPEFDLALYTICFMARADHPCPVELNGIPLNITTCKPKAKHKGIKLRSAFPDIQ